MLPLYNFESGRSQNLKIGKDWLQILQMQKIFYVAIDIIWITVYKLRTEK